MGHGVRGPRGREVRGPKEIAGRVRTAIVVRGPREIAGRVRTVDAAESVAGRGPTGVMTGVMTGAVRGATIGATTGATTARRR